MLYFLFEWITVSGKLCIETFWDNLCLVVSKALSTYFGQALALGAEMLHLAMLLFGVTDEVSCVNIGKGNIKLCFNNLWGWIATKHNTNRWIMIVTSYEGQTVTSGNVPPIEWLRAWSEELYTVECWILIKVAPNFKTLWVFLKSIFFSFVFYKPY